MYAFYHRFMVLKFEDNQSAQSASQAVASTTLGFSDNIGLLHKIVEIILYSGKVSIVESPDKLETSEVIVLPDVRQVV